MCSAFLLASPSDIKSNYRVSFKANDDETPMCKAYSSKSFVELLRQKENESPLIRPIVENKCLPLGFGCAYTYMLKSATANSVLQPMSRHCVLYRM